MVKEISKIFWEILRGINTVQFNQKLGQSFKGMT